MSEIIYRKGEDPEIDADLKNARTYAGVKLGDKNVFYKRGLRRYVMPIADVARYYLRVDEVMSHVSCCPQDFNTKTLILITAGGETVEARIGDALYGHEDEKLIEDFREKHPEIRFSKTE